MTDKTENIKERRARQRPAQQVHTSEGTGLEQPGEPAVPMASARALDLEYGDIADPLEDDAPRQVYGQCPHCSEVAYLSFVASLDAWELFVDLICQVTTVPQRRLLDSGKRPSDSVFRARRLLVHALAKIAGESDCVRWMQFAGFERRWVKEALAVELDDEYIQLLLGMDLTLLVSLRGAA